MSATFDPGPGWRETTDPMERLSRPRLVLETDNGNSYWVREEPVPLLPTEPYTVIRVTWKTGGTSGALVLQDRDQWTGEAKYGTQALAGLITGFEVLAEPIDTEAVEEAYDRGYQQGQGDTRERVRRETAEAVLDRVYAGYQNGVGGTVPARFRDELGAIGRRFGVGS